MVSIQGRGVATTSPGELRAALTRPRRRDDKDPKANR
jgi:hypothetical protein